MIPAVGLGIDAETIAKALGGRRSGRGWVARCPAHDDRNPSLSIAEGRAGRPVLFCFAGCQWPEIRDALQAKGLWPDHGLYATARYDHVSPAWRCTDPERNQRQRIDPARRLWAAVRPITDRDPAGCYLASRGLPGPWPATLRFVSNVRHPSGETVPALVAAACRWPDHEPVAVQLTALTADGRKAPVEPLRWTRGVLRSAKVRLAPWREDRPIVLVEGTEDGLAVLRALSDVTPWAVLGASNAAHAVLPEGADVILAFDGDDAGRRASAVAAEALSGRGHRVRVATLPEGRDLNDLLQAVDAVGRAA